MAERPSSEFPLSNFIFFIVLSLTIFFGYAALMRHFNPPAPKPVAQEIDKAKGAADKNKDADKARRLIRIRKPTRPKWPPTRSRQRRRLNRP